MDKYFIFATAMFLNYACAGEIPKEKGLYAIIQTSKGDIVVKLFEEKTPVTVSNFTGLAEGTKEWKDPKTGNMVKKRYYKNLTFHRIINDFMIQGGCPLGTGTGGPGFQFQDECYEILPISGMVDNDKEASAVWADVVIPYAKKYNDPATGEVSGPSDLLNKKYKEVSTKRSYAPLHGQSIEVYVKESGLNKKPHGRGKLIGSVEYGTICMANAGPNTNGSQFFIVTKKGGTPWLNGKHTVFGSVVSGMEIAHEIEKIKKGNNDKPVDTVYIKDIIIKRV